VGKPLSSKLLLLPLAVLLSSAVCAEQIVLDFDPAKTTIHWTLTGNMHIVHGTFKLKQGQISFDPSTGAISGELMVDAVSGESGNRPRDRRMQKDILESSRFPEISFVPNKVDASLPVTGTTPIRLSGVFTIHGAPHEIVIPVEASISGSEVTGKGKFVIPFVEWGMKDPSIFLLKVAKTVEVEVFAAGHVVNGR
jgi:polyisoprenoid-binding protein YceI